MDINLIGKNIAKHRKNNGYTQESLAEKLNITAQAVSKWETGLGLPETTIIIELSKLFHISIDEIIQPEIYNNPIINFMNKNLLAPDNKILNKIPRISRWNPPEGCNMFYSMPAMIAEALCCIEAYENGRQEAVSITELNERFCALMHIMGISYGFLWEENRHVIEELWRVNQYKDMVDRVMRYYGREYLWLNKNNATPEEMKRIIIWSIDRGHPVVMEFAGGIPEFNIVTGYEDCGNTLLGYTYCEECAAKTNDCGMFVNPARWNENFDFYVLVIGDKKQPSYTDKDSMQFAIDVLNQNNPSHKDYLTFKFTSGDLALKKWLDACDTYENTLKLFAVPNTEPNMYKYALYMNSIYTQQCIQSYLKKLSVNYSRKINDIIIQIGIAFDRLVDSWFLLLELKDKPDEFLSAAREHINKLIKHREYLRGWFSELYRLM